MAKKEGGGSLFAAAQQIGKSLFLPIAVLPPAGILLGLGRFLYQCDDDRDLSSGGCPS